MSGKEKLSFDVTCEDVRSAGATCRAIIVENNKRADCILNIAEGKGNPRIRIECTGDKELFSRLRS